MAAPPSRPSRSASASAVGSTNPPRAVLISTASRFIRESRSAPIIPRVAGTSGQVHPAAGLVGAARSSGAFVVEVNPEPAYEGVADAVLVQREAFGVRIQCGSIPLRVTGRQAVQPPLGGECVQLARAGVDPEDFLRIRLGGFIRACALQRDAPGLRGQLPSQQAKQRGLATAFVAAYQRQAWGPGQ